jgi:hypothetical protein
LENGYEKEYVSTLIQEKQKRREYQKNTKKNAASVSIPTQNPNYVSAPVPIPVPQLIPLAYFIPLIKMD